MLNCITYVNKHFKLVRLCNCASNTQRYLLVVVNKRSKANFSFYSTRRNRGSLMIKIKEILQALVLSIYSQIISIQPQVHHNPD